MLNAEGRYEWNCPRLDCKRYILAWTQTGLAKLSEEHMDQHYREDRQKITTKALVHSFPAKDYNKLKLTVVDIGFLKTRHIKIDENIETDSCIDPVPVTDRQALEELSYVNWVRALHNSWSIVPPKEDKNGTK